MAGCFFGDFDYEENSFRIMGVIRCICNNRELIIHHFCNNSYNLGVICCKLAFALSYSPFSIKSWVLDIIRQRSLETYKSDRK